MELVIILKILIFRLIKRLHKVKVPSGRKINYDYSTQELAQKHVSVNVKTFENILKE